MGDETGAAERGKLIRVKKGGVSYMETALSMIAIVVSLLSFVFALYTFIWTRQRD